MGEFAIGGNAIWYVVMRACLDGLFDFRNDEIMDFHTNISEMDMAGDLDGHPKCYVVSSTKGAIFRILLEKDEHKYEVRYTYSLWESGDGGDGWVQFPYCESHAPFQGSLLHGWMMGLSGGDFPHMICSGIPDKSFVGAWRYREGASWTDDPSSVLQYEMSK